MSKKTTQDIADSSIASLCLDVVIDLGAFSVETGRTAAVFAVVVVLWLLAPVVIPAIAWHRRFLARQWIADWESRCGDGATGSSG